MEVNNIGIIHFNEGDYIGEVENGKANGYGRLIYHNGDVYLGEFRGNCQTGIGAKSTSGYTALGTFSNGRLNGKCILSKKVDIGDKYYIGNFSNGTKSGKGYSVNAYGTKIYYGNFANDLPNGKGYEGEGLYFNGGSVVEGNFVNGQVSGQYVSYGKTTFNFSEYRKGTFYGDVTDNLRHYFGYGAWVYDAAHATIEFGYHNKMNGRELAYNFRGVKVYQNKGTGISIEEGYWQNGETKKDGSNFAKIYKEGNLYMGDYSDNNRSGNGIYATFEFGNLTSISVRNNGRRHEVSKGFRILEKGKFSKDRLIDGVGFYDNKEAFIVSSARSTKQFVQVDYMELSGTLNDGSCVNSGGSFDSSADTYREKTVQELVAERLERERANRPPTPEKSAVVEETIYQPVVHDYGDGYGETLTFKERLKLQLEERKARKQQKKSGASTTSSYSYDYTAESVTTTPKAPPKPASKPNEHVQKLNEEYEFREHRTILAAVKVKKEVHVLPDGVKHLYINAFCGDLSIKQFKGGKNLERLDPGAFLNCTNLEKVNLLRTRVKEIPNEAFKNCTNLKTLILPASYKTNIRHESAFEGCNKDLVIVYKQNKYSLEDYISFALGGRTKFDVTFESSAPKTETIDNFTVERSGSGSFAQVKLVKVDKFTEKLTLPNGLNSIASELFANNTTIRVIDGAKDLTDLPSNAFKGCKNLELVDLSQTKITSIYKETFKDCVKLKTVKLPDTVTTIYESAFEICTALANIDGYRIQEIAKYAFKDCKSLKFFTPFPNAKIDSTAFSGCDNLVAFDLYDANPVYINEEVLSCYSRIKGDFLRQRLAWVDKFMFSDFTKLERIDLPRAGVIYEGAFANCPSLKEVYAPEAFLIEKGAFANCLNLEKIVVRKDCKIKSGALPNKLKAKKVKSQKIKKEKTKSPVAPALKEDLTAFEIVKREHYDYAAVKLLRAEEKMAVPKEIEFIGADVFAGNMVVKELTFGDSLKEIFNWSFKGCKNLEKVDLSKTKIKDIPLAAFEDCVHLKKIILPPTVETIYADAFKNCLSLTSINLPNVVDIRDSAFYKCIHLEHVYAPRVKTIDKKAFSHCKMFKEIEGTAEISNTSDNVTPLDAMPLKDNLIITFKKKGKK